MIFLLFCLHECSDYIIYFAVIFIFDHHIHFVGCEHTGIWGYNSSLYLYAKDFDDVLILSHYSIILLFFSVYFCTKKFISDHPKNLNTKKNLSFPFYSFIYKNIDIDKLEPKSNKTQKSFSYLHFDSVCFYPCFCFLQIISGDKKIFRMRICISDQIP